MKVGKIFFQLKGIHKYTREMWLVIDLLIIEDNSLKRIKDIRVIRAC